MLRGFRQKLQERGERKEQEQQEVVEQARLASQAEQEERRRQQDIRDRVLVIIREGKVPEMDVQNESVPFKLQRTEKMLLAIGNVPYSEMRVKREIQGRSTGASVRVARGMSVRVGGSRGTPVETDVLTPRGVGLFGLSTKHVFFNGERTFRIPIAKIVSAQVVNVGLEIVRDRASAQPEFFGLSEDGAEFVVDLIHALEDADFGRGEPEMQNVTNYVLMGDGGDDILLDE